MAELFRRASDDQLALIFCGAALLVCGTIMALSYYVGQWGVRPAESAEALPFFPRAAQDKAA